jgi:gamma-glutamyl phosphate reductase
MKQEIISMAKKARQAARGMLSLSTADKNRVLLNMAQALEEQKDFICRGK